ncbi:MAG: hypothetical protein V3V08_13330 [Nannocystaceae bacterium]
MSEVETKHGAARPVRGPADPYHHLSPLRGTGIVVLRRTERRYCSLVEMEESFAFIHSELRLIRATDRRCLLVDARKTRGRNDAEFELAMAPHRRRLQRSFERVAVLLRSTIGCMQVERYARTDEAVLLAAFTDHSEAVAWLMRRSNAGTKTD